MNTLISVVALTVLISFICSLCEAVLYSTRMGTLEAAKNDEKRGHKALQMIRLKSRISVPLSAILILNTLANTAGATIAGMYAAGLFSPDMVLVFSGILTLMILIFGEIIPKTLGAGYWRVVWPSIILPLTLMKIASYPLIYVIQKLTEILNPTSEAQPHVTEEDILGTIRLGAKGGEISQLESLMIHNIIQLEAKTVGEIMTPRTVMFTLDEEMTVAQSVEICSEEGFSRIPVYRGDRENVVGYVMLADLASVNVLTCPETRLKDLTKPIMFVKETQNCLAMLTQFLKKRLHIAMVDDEYGGVAGLVTLEDLIETVLGAEIVDENDTTVDMRKMALKRTQQRDYVADPELPDATSPSVEGISGVDMGEEGPPPEDDDVASAETAPPTDQDALTRESD